ncbi:MAG: cytochrome bc1 complex Rieske iron-sulfur subunit, partial [Cellulosimicrobium funkei]
FKHTLWQRGTRLAIDPSGRPIKAADVTIGSVVHVIPEASQEEMQSHEWITEKAKAVVLLVRLDPRDIVSEQAPAGESWSYDGIVAFSKICTHVGCPVALYEQQTHHLLCPCHQSTFDVADSAKVVFGPAKRPLPQLPITVDDEGYLVAQSDFHEPIGPSFWERLK